MHSDDIVREDVITTVPDHLQKLETIRKVDIKSNKLLYIFKI